MNDIEFFKKKYAMVKKSLDNNKHLSITELMDAGKVYGSLMKELGKEDFKKAQDGQLGDLYFFKANYCLQVTRDHPIERIRANRAKKNVIIYSIIEIIIGLIVIFALKSYLLIILLIVALGVNLFIYSKHMKNINNLDIAPDAIENELNAILNK